MAPASDGKRVGPQNFEEAAQFERTNASLRCHRFSEATFDSKLLLALRTGEERPIPMSIKLYVGNLSFQTSSEDLQQLFAQVGTVESATVVEDRDTGRSRGFGFVEMSSKEEGQKAIEEFNGKDLNGRNLTVNEARPREDRGNRGGGRGFGGNRGGGRNFGGGGGRNDRNPRW
jgi:RNA recognition motif-containing protein